ncbi:hypothetical protein Tco_0758717 [Tanacetum coccineum]
MSVSIGSSRGAPPSEVHDECLYWKFTRSASIEGLSLKGFDRTPHKSVSFGSTTKNVSKRENTSDRKNNTRFRSKKVLARPPSEGYNQKVDQKCCFGSINCSSEGVPLFQSKVVSRELIIVARPEVARPELVVAHPEVARPELVVARPEVSRLELVVARPEVARSELVVACLEVARVVARPEVARVVIRPEVARPELVVVARLKGSYGDRIDLVRRRLGPLIKELGEKANALLTISPAEAPQSRNHIQPPQTQDTSIEDVPSDRGSKKGFEGVSGCQPKWEDKVRYTVGDKIGKELLHLAPSPYYMPYPYDESLSSHPPNMKGEWGEIHAVKLGILKKELFKDPKVRKAIIDRVPIPTQLLKAEGLTLKELSDRHDLTKEAAHHHRKTPTPASELHYLLDIPIRKRRKNPISPLSKGSGTPGGGRTTPKKLDLLRTGLTDQDLDLLLLSEHSDRRDLEVSLLFDILLWCFNGDLDLLRFLLISKDLLEELLLALLGGYLTWELLNLYLRISMENFSKIHCILLGISSKTRSLWELSCLLEAACQSLTCIKLGHQGQSFPHAPSTGCGPDVCAIRTSYTGCSLPPEETGCSLPPEETGCSLLPEETCCSLPLEETGCSLPPEETSCSLPPEETGCSLPPKDTCWSLPPEETGCSLPPNVTCWSLPPEETGCSVPYKETGCSLPLEETLLLSYFLWT